MFRFKKVSILIIVAIVSGLISCNKDDLNDGELVIVGDVFILKRVLNDKIQYGQTYYLYGNYPLSSASVATPDGDNIPLSAYDALSLIYSNDPFAIEYSETLPQNGTFDFTAKYLEQDYTTTDNLDFTDMAIPEITSTEYLSSTQTLKVDWNAVPGADSYIIRMLNVDNDVFFTGYLLDEDATSYEINTNTGTWLDLPNYNQPLVLELHASRYEENADGLETYNIEETSIAEKTIYWGLD